MIKLYMQQRRGWCSSSSGYARKDGGVSARSTMHAAAAAAAAVAAARPPRAAATVAMAATSKAAAAGGAGGMQQQQQQRPSADEATELALVLLVHENLKRRAGRPLLPDGADLLNARAIAEALDCAVALFGTASPPSSGGAAAAPLLYANEAARGALASWLPPDGGSSSSASGRSGGSSGGAPDAVCFSLPPPAAAVGVPAADSKCVEASRVVWQPSSGAGRGPLELDRLLVCPITSPNDAPLGACLLFDAWRYPSDGAVGRPGFPRVAPSELPDEAALTAAADGVRAQADAVRALKQQRGLPNQHPEVAAAVAELAARKAGLARLEALAAAFAAERPPGSGVSRWLPLPDGGRDAGLAS